VEPFEAPGASFHHVSVLEKSNTSFMSVAHVSKFRGPSSRRTITAAGSHLWLERTAFSARRQTVPDHLRRDALCARAASILAAAHAPDEGHGNEHAHNLCVLEPA